LKPFGSMVSDPLLVEINNVFSHANMLIQLREYKYLALAGVNEFSLNLRRVRSKEELSLSHHLSLDPALTSTRSGFF
jgi:hypothetical protein